MMIAKKTILIFLCLGFIIVSKLQAQIINIEDKRSHIADTTAWFGRIDLGFKLHQNQSTIFTLTGGMQLEYVKMKQLLLFSNSFNLIKIEADNFINDGFQHIRYNYRMNKKLTYEAFIQGQYNQKILIKFRGLIGTGLRYQPFPKEKVFFGLSYMYQYEVESVTNDTRRENRLSSYLSFSINPRPNFRLAHISYIQPLIADFRDIRLSSKTTLNINLTNKLLFQTSFSITFDSRLPVDIPNTIYSFDNGLRWIIK